MIKKLSLLALISCFVFAGISAFSQEQSVTVLNPNDFPAKAESLVGQKVQVDGMVVHVCKHGGKKMFIVGDNPDINVKIDASDAISVFNADLEGSTVSVEGVVVAIEVEAVPEQEHADKKGEASCEYEAKKAYSISCNTVKIID